MKHILNCPRRFLSIAGSLFVDPNLQHYDHDPSYDNGGATTETVYGPMWCIDPSTKEIIKIHIPHSVLAARMVCRKMKEDMGLIFWKVNHFYFGSSYMAYQAIERIPWQFAKEIRKITFEFASQDANETFPELAQMCPNLEALCIYMDYEGVHENYEHNLVSYPFPFHLREYSHSPETTLKRAEGIEIMRRSINNLKTLRLVGFDQIQVPHAETNELVAIEVDVNHPDAVGPWLQAGMVAPTERKQPFV